MRPYNFALINLAKFGVLQHYSFVHLMLTSIIRAGDVRSEPVR